MIKKEILFEEMNSLIPSLVPGRHKGQNGKIGVIGGSFEYTGAPYYGAAAALRGGGDLSHIFCTNQAATPIKSYSPEIIVHPYLIAGTELKREATLEEVKDCVNSTSKWYSALNAMIIGSGLGRDDAISQCIEDLYGNLESTITICDGDFFWYLTEKNKEKLAEKIRKRAKYTVLTPNAAEFKRIWDFLQIERELTSDEEKEAERKKFTSEVKSPLIEIPIDNPLAVDYVEVSKKLGNVNILAKGEFDIITNGKEAYAVLRKTSQKRSGGQGDIMAGLVALYCFWDQNRQNELEIDPNSDEFSILRGCMLGSYITRHAAALAYEKYKYGLTAPHVLDEIYVAINSFVDKGLTSS